jgi:hypothetical protein
VNIFFFHRSINSTAHHCVSLPKPFQFDKQQYITRVKIELKTEIDVALLSSQCRIAQCSAKVSAQLLAKILKHRPHCTGWTNEIDGRVKWVYRKDAYNITGQTKQNQFYAWGFFLVGILWVCQNKSLLYGFYIWKLFNLLKIIYVNFMYQFYFYLMPSTVLLLHRKKKYLRRASACSVNLYTVFGLSSVSRALQRDNKRDVYDDSTRKKKMEM